MLENAPHSRSRAGRCGPGPTGWPRSSGPCRSRTPCTWRCCPWCEARTAPTIHSTTEAARVHLITLIIQPPVLACPNPPPETCKVPSTEEEEEGWVVLGWWGGPPLGPVNLTSFWLPSSCPAPLDMGICPVTTARAAGPTHAPSSLPPPNSQLPPAPSPLHQTGYFYTHQQSYAC